MQFSAASLRSIKMEIKVLSQLSHPNIVAFKGACLAPPHICILEELAEGGSLHGRLYSRSSRRTAPPAARSSAAGSAAAAAVGDVQALTTAAAAASRRRGRPGSSSTGRLHALPLSVPEVLRIAIDVASAMQYLHNMQPQVVHRDLKPQNVLLDLQGRAKVRRSVDALLSAVLQRSSRDGAAHTRIIHHNALAVCWLRLSSQQRSCI
jgi:serine/threonine protein kinase